MAQVEVLVGGARHLGLHFLAVVAVEAVALDDGGIDAVAIEDMLEGALDRGRAGAGGTGDGNDWMLLGHCMGSPSYEVWRRRSGRSAVITRHRRSTGPTWGPVSELKRTGPVSKRWKNAGVLIYHGIQAVGP
jgi:hypothetical protein